MSFTQKKSDTTGLTYYANSPVGTPEQLILVLSGAGASGSMLLPLLEVLAKERPTNLYVAPDLPGTGDSSTTLCSELTFREFGKLLNELCEEFGNISNHKVLAGHSMGCRLALETFSQSPDKVSDVILIDGSWNGPKPPAQTAQDIPPLDIMKQHMLAVIEGSFGPQTPEEFKETERKRCNEMDQAMVEYLVNITIENRTWDATRMIEVLQQLGKAHESAHPVRVLVIQAMEGSGSGGARKSLKKGDESSFMRLVKENAGDAYNSIVIEDAGHFVPIEQPNDVAQAILPIISGA